MGVGLEWGRRWEQVTGWVVGRHLKYIFAVVG